MSGNICANKTDALIFFVCVCPLSALIYTSCYYLLLELHPNQYEYATLAAYGFLQFILGYVAGYCAAKTIYFTAPDVDDAQMEEIPLLINTIHPPAADNEETLQA